MPRPPPYGSDRSWVARSTEMCETCRWFADDTHPEYQTFGIDRAERTARHQQHFHKMFPCKTPGLAAGGAAPSQSVSRLYHRVGAIEAARMAPAAAAPQPTRRQGSQRRAAASSGSQSTPAPQRRAASPAAAASGLTDALAKRQSKPPDYLSPKPTEFRPERLVEPGGFRNAAGGAAATPSSSAPPKRARPATGLPKPRDSRCRTASRWTMMRTTNATAVMAAIALTQLAQRLTQPPRLAKLQPRWWQRRRGRGGVDGCGVRCGVTEMHATVCARLGVCIAVTRCTDCADCAAFLMCPAAGCAKAHTLARSKMATGPQLRAGMWWGVPPLRVPVLSCGPVAIFDRFRENTSGVPRSCIQAVHS